MNLGHTNTLFHLWKADKILIESGRPMRYYCALRTAAENRRGASADF
jgi:hypothetical protein